MLLRLAFSTRDASCYSRHLWSTVRPILKRQSLTFGEVLTRSRLSDRETHSPGYACLMTQNENDSCGWGRCMFPPLLALFRIWLWTCTRLIKYPWGSDVYDVTFQPPIPNLRPTQISAPDQRFSVSLVRNGIQQRPIFCVGPNSVFLSFASQIFRWNHKLSFQVNPHRYDSCFIIGQAPDTVPPNV